MEVKVARFLAVLALVLTGALAALTSPAMAAPANDNYANAQTIGPAIPVTVSATNVGATTEAFEPSITGNAPVSTVWFKWTAPATQTVVVDLCAKDFSGGDPDYTERFAVRTGGSVSTTTSIMEMTGECRERFNAIAGTVYRLQFDYGSDQGTFSFSLRPLTPPANDNYASPTVLSPTLPVTLNTNNIDSTGEVGEPIQLGAPTTSRSVWFAWSAVSTGQVRVDICDATQSVGPLNRVIAVYTGNTIGTAVLVKYTSNCQMAFDATAGTTYHFGVSGTTNRGEFSFVFKFVNAPKPNNDNFANATAVGPGLPVSLPGDNSFSTVEPGEPDHNGFGSGDHSDWYKWTSSVSQRVRIRACPPTPNGNEQARIGLYTGATLVALTPVGDPPNYGPYCSVNLDAVAGVTYSIAASGSSSDHGAGAYVLDIHVLKVPPNDNFANATVLSSTVPFSVASTTVDATVEDEEPSHPFGGTGGNDTPSVWFKWTAPSDDAAIFSACSATQPNLMAIYTEPVKPRTSLYELDPVARSEQGCRDGSKGPRLALAPEKGRVYYIAVASAKREFESDFTLTGSPPVAEVITPPKSTFNLKKAIAKCKKIKGKGKKVKKKRANCIKAAKKKAAIIKCKKLSGNSAQAKCIKKANKKFATKKGGKKS